MLKILRIVLFHGLYIIARIKIWGHRANYLLGGQTKTPPNRFHA